VKMVTSGDTVVIRGVPTKGPPPEKTLSFAGVMAPRLARRPSPNDSRSTVQKDADGNERDSSKDQPGAWAAREFLRRKLIGQKVNFMVAYTAGAGGREFGTVFIGEGPTAQNMTETVLEAGLVRLHGKERAGEADYDRLVAASQKGQDSKIGLFGPPKPDDVRDIKWECNENDRRVIMEEYRNTPVRAVVEYVRDSCTVRAFLLPKFTNVMICLTGIRPSSRDDAIAAEGKYFTESRLLQREVSVVVEGWTGKAGNATANLMGTVQHPRGNISEFLLKEGFVRINDYSFKNIKTNKEMLRAAQNYAQSQKKRCWAEYKPREAIKDGKYSATVIEVINPERVRVRKDDGSEGEVQLASVRQPRRPRKDDAPKKGDAAPAAGADSAAAGDAGARRGPRDEASRPLYSVPFMFKAREFLRTKLIGKKVDISIEFVKPAEGRFPEKSCVTMSLNGEDVSKSLIRQGLATVVRYRDDDDQRVSNYIDLLQAEDEAEMAKAGVHSITEKSPAGYGTQPVSTASGEMLGYQNKGWIAGIVEYVVSGSRVRVYVPKDTSIATVLLGAVVCPRTAPRNSDKEDEPFSQEATEFVKNTILQQSIEFKVEKCDKNGNFIGQIRCNGKDLAVSLVEKGLSKLHFTAQYSDSAAELTVAEEAAKSQLLNLWADYDAAAAAAAAAANAAETGEPTPSKGSLTGPDQWKTVVVSHVDDAVTFWVQDQKKQEELAALMKTLNDTLAAGTTPAPEDIYHKKNEAGKKVICAAKFGDGQYYRAVCESKTEDKTKYIIRYIDYGNVEEVDLATMVNLPQEVADIGLGAQASKCSLAFLNGPAADYMEDATDFFADGVLYKTYKCSEKMYDPFGDDNSQPVSLMYTSEEDGKTTYGDIAKTMVENGFATVNGRARVAKSAEKHKNETVGAYRKLQEAAVKSRTGQWMYGDVTEDPKDI